MKISAQIILNLSTQYMVLPDCQKLINDTIKFPYVSSYRECWHTGQRRSLLRRDIVLDSLCIFCKFLYPNHKIGSFFFFFSICLSYEIQLKEKKAFHEVFVKISYRFSVLFPCCTIQHLFSYLMSLSLSLCIPFVFVCSNYLLP